MAREIFSNAAVTRLAQSLSSTELVLTVETTVNFPTPVVGDEFFTITIAGACNTDVEVMRAVEICGPNCIRVDTRGYQGTTAQAFSPGDMAYHSLTATAAQQIMDRFQWFLGAFDAAPVQDNNGFPLVDGMIYWDSILSQMFVYSGATTTWVLFTPLLATSILEEFTWVPTVLHAGGTALPFPDIYSRSASEWIAGDYTVKLTLNGTHQVEEINGGAELLGDYTVVYSPTNTITPKQDIQIGDVVVATVMVNSDVGTTAFIERTETSTVDYDFVNDDDTLAGDSATKLVTEQAIKAYTDGKVRWRNNWAAQAYAVNDMVVDGSYLAVANSVTGLGDKPAPTAVGSPSFGVAAPTWLNSSAGTVLIASNDFTVNTDGWVTAFKVFTQDPATLSDWQFTLYDVTAPGSPIEIYTGPVLSADANNSEFLIGSHFVSSGTIVEAQLTLNAVASAATIKEDASFWPGGVPSWASAVTGRLNIDAADVGVATTAYGVDVQFQPSTTPSALWDLIPLGSGGGGGLGGGGGEAHIVSTVAPTAGEGSDGDIWFVELV